MNSVQKRVLIVDDEEDLTWTLSKKLSKDNDKFQLICVNSGKDAKEVLNQLPVDLVITDIRMPEVSGLDLLVEIKEKFPQTKVILMTAYGSANVQKSATERGCFSYLEKPFEINEFRELILNALTEKKGFDGNVSDFQLSDIIQLNCLGRHTLTLKIIHDDETGYIYFDDGNIVHSETNTLEGENAFYYILSWHGGEFSISRNRWTSVQTIKKGWQSLLLEALRRSDENPDVTSRGKEQEKRQRILKIHQILYPLLKVKGINLIVVHNSAGFPFTYLPENFDRIDEIEEIGNQISAIYNDFKKKDTISKSMDPSFFECHFKNNILFSRKDMESDTIISVSSNPQINIGKFRVQLRKTIDKIKIVL